MENADRWFFDNKRPLITSAAIAFIVYVLLMSGIFSYLHSEDSVTNRLNARTGSVTIKEPDWDSEGQFMAQHSEPGMEIKKDPYGFNDGETDLYIRLKMTVELGAFDKKSKTEDYLSQYDNTDNESRRLESVINAIRLVDGNGVASDFIMYNEESQQWECYNHSFVIESQELSDETGKQVFYFYYIQDKANASDPDIMQTVKPDEATDELFQRIDIPVFKKDYLGVFDQSYSIVLEAEGITTDERPDLTVEDAKTLFAEEKH